MIFTFRGRIDRAKFWLGVLSLVLMSLILLYFIVQIVVGPGGIPVAVVALALVVILVWRLFAIVIKRLHDRNKSGWWSLVVIVLPAALNAAAFTYSNIGLLFSLVGLVIGIWAVVELGCMKGTTGSNRYGPDPLPFDPPGSLDR